MAVVSDPTFVAPVRELRRGHQLAVADSARRLALRDSILRAHRVTAVQLEHAARVFAVNPDRAQRIWARIDSLPSPAMFVPRAARSSPGRVATSAHDTSKAAAKVS